MRLVSLGRACEVAFQIRMHTPKVDADFFDWLITPFDGLMMALENDLAHLLEADDLYLQADRNFVNNRVTGIQYGHVFMRDHTNVHPDNFIDDLDRVASIFEYLRRKFLANIAAGGPIGFARRGLTPEQGRELAAFFSRRCPRLDFRIVAVNAIGQGIDDMDPRRFTELIVPETGPDGLGRSQEWADALVKAGLTEQPFVKTRDDVFHRLMVHMGGDVQTLVEEAAGDPVEAAAGR